MRTSEWVRWELFRDVDSEKMPLMSLGVLVAGVCKDRQMLDSEGEGS